MELEILPHNNKRRNQCVQLVKEEMNAEHEISISTETGNNGSTGFQLSLQAEARFIHPGYTWLQY